MSSLVIVSVPNFKGTGKSKHYLIRSNNTDDLTLIGDVAISGSIIGVSSSYQDAYDIYSNLNY